MLAHPVTDVVFMLNDKDKFRQYFTDGWHNS